MAGYKPRVIGLTRKPGQTFGFYLRVEQGRKGHLIRCLEMGGPAELAGMKDGDRIVRVNGTYVDELPHSQVVDLVKESGVSVTFHILDKASYKQAKEQNVELADTHPTPVVNNVSNKAPELKLCYLIKSGAGFGFSVRSVKGEQGVFMTEVTAGGVADMAGVNVKDRVLEVNGESVEDATHERVVEMIKAAGSNIMFLLADEEAVRYYQSKQLKMGVWLATTKYLPHKPRIADITRGSDGLGFSLRKEPNHTGHIIKNIDRGSPGDRAGLMDKDRLVALYGTEVDSLSHEQLVNRIKQSGNRFCFLVVDKETDQMYKKAGASPMIFWEEMRGSAAPPSYTEALTLSTPVRPSTPVQEREEPLKPKLCRMEKAACGYGFHLNGIQGLSGQSITQVVRGGAADRAGLEDEDVVVEVNWVNVEKSMHEEVVLMIRNSGDSLVMLVAQKSVYDQLVAKGVSITPQLLGQTSTIQVHSSETGRDERLEEEEEEARPGTPPAQTRERSPSVSSAESFDDKL
ncbi:Na(+)/H(+) exchange regulatory cofactor NHE-RF3 [Genypterus blacodes]|uniref:Na(+)/H(+) exchange regulatory cofactor NHE-RF3 n=1 Tax=Genypterus blacodes TaxID=154954 RepID=UPI003F7576BC